MNYYCPNCWTIIQDTDAICPNCRYNLADFDTRVYEEKLLGALHHAVPERRRMAAQILGNIHSQRAVPVFKQMVEEQASDYFFMRAVLLSVAKIEHPERISILRLAARSPYRMVAELAEELMAQLAAGTEMSEWDPHTG